MAAIVRTQLQQKAINKVTGVMQDYPLGIEFGELMQKTGYKKSALYNVLSMVGASKSDEGLWHLPHRNTSDAPVNEATEDDVATAIDQPVMQETAGSLQDDTENMQDEELNTQAPQVSSPDNDGATLINTPAPLVNTSAEVVNPSVSKINMGDYSVDDIDTDADQSSNGQAIETATVSASDDATLIDEGAKSDGNQATVNQKRFILIENCLLSLSRDEIGESPCLAKDCWFDSHGNDIPLESPDGKFLQKAVGGFCSDAIFRGEEYYRRYTLQSQLFHGVFDSPEDAEYRIAELMFIKPDKNHFEIIEV